MGSIENKVVIITGAGSGIGKETALLLALEGAKVVLVGRRANLLEQLVSEIGAKGGTAFARPADIASRDQLFDLANWVRHNIGPTDIVIHSAGSNSEILNPRFMSEEDWNATINVNMTAVFNLTQALLPDMIARGSGTIITVSSQTAITANLLGGAAYGAAKAGVRNFMTFLHNTYRNQGIRATTILPGETDTPILNRRARPPEESERAMMLRPHDVAQAIHLCASLQQGAVIPELHICPTATRDTSVDMELARWLGAPAGTPDRPGTP